ncbi:TetR/AcrR family transcriptional regulator [Asanoa siamensis]|uniref:HTH tetR-type domain-containing protein n=1 Tax=Asanoa siamensis TaxID=926357 RepID=A0ABQ4CQF4_9ACTN|nr:TetR family transcriptional regulator [Asanoa siamensis]GIF73491.1 hypothetical protein Asi02nite_30090 [Asanoa siamensis]
MTQPVSRRVAILDAARAMLAERGVAEISLRELADRIGLAKSNVLRYYDSREAIFLEVLDQEWIVWLDALEAAVADVPTGDAEGVARALAATLHGRSSGAPRRRTLRTCADAPAGFSRRWRCRGGGSRSGPLP